MSKNIAAPINPETEVTREDIAQMANCSLCKVGFVTSRDKWGFPNPIRSGPKGIVLYCRAAVEAWLENNDLKTMVFTAEDRAPIGTYKKVAKGIDSCAVAQLKIGIKPVTAKGPGKTLRVRTEAYHEHEQLHPQFARQSNNYTHNSHGRVTTATTVFQ